MVFSVWSVGLQVPGFNPHQSVARPFTSEARVIQKAAVLKAATDLAREKGWLPELPLWPTWIPSAALQTFAFYVKLEFTNQNLASKT